MSCSCLKNDFNLFLSNTNCKTLILEDQSIWSKGDFYAEGEKLVLTVKPLSTGQEKTINLVINKRNSYTSTDILGIDNSCLPDDLYCFTTVNCGKSYSIVRANLCNTFCKIEQLKAKAKTQEDIDHYRSLEDLAEQIKVNAEFGKVQTASDLLKILNRKLKNIRCGLC